MVMSPSHTFWYRKSLLFQGNPWRSYKFSRHFSNLGSTRWKLKEAGFLFLSLKGVLLLGPCFLWMVRIVKHHKSQMRIWMDAADRWFKGEAQGEQVSDWMSSPLDWSKRLAGHPMFGWGVFLHFSYFVSQGNYTPESSPITCFSCM